MKLLTKTTIYYLVITLLLFSIGGIVFYVSLRSIISENIDENLEQTQEQVLYYTKKTGKLPAQPSVGSDILLFTPADLEIKSRFRDTVYYSEFEEEALPYRELVFSVKTNEGWYTTTAGKTIIEADDMIESVAQSLGIVAGILLVVLFLMNWFLSKSMWKPFYKTLDALKRFDLSNREAEDLLPTGIAEFNLLNEALNKMTGKILSDYRNLKEFTENASHELQTPLAIIRSKLELMIQVEGLPEDQVNAIREIYESVNRLSKLNQSLLLLSKIENGQFHETMVLDMKTLVEKKITQLAELTELKGITVENAPIGTFEIKMNAQLADILISNILSNAIRHNISGGKIKVELKDTSLLVCNSGNPPEVPAEKLFKRFQKSGSSGESVGLGLSIVKQICDSYNLNVHYTYNEGMHCMRISF